MTATVLSNAALEEKKESLASPFTCGIVGDPGEKFQSATFLLEVFQWYSFFANCATCYRSSPTKIANYKLKRSAT